MFKHWMEIVHYNDNGYLDWLFHQNVIPLSESNSIQCLAMAKDSHLRNYLEVHSLNSDQVPFNSIENFFRVQWMDLLIFFPFEVYYKKEFVESFGSNSDF